MSPSRDDRLSPPERDALAGEYVLGLLDGAERAAAERRLDTDRDFAASVERWRLHFFALDATATPLAPSPSLWSRIEASLTSAVAPARAAPSPAPTASRLADWWNSLFVWRGAAFAGALATVLLAVGLGLGAVLTAFPSLHLALKIAGVAYLLYLAWRIAMSRSMSNGDNAKAKPMTFLEAAAFQWVNPKAWVMAVSAMAVYTSPASPFLSVIIVAAAFAVVNLPSVSTWAGFGTALRGFLSDPARLKWFNIAMGLLLVASLWPMLR